MISYRFNTHQLKSEENILEKNFHVAHKTCRESNIRWANINI